MDYYNPAIYYYNPVIDLGTAKIGRIRLLLIIIIRINNNLYYNPDQSYDRQTADITRETRD